MGLIGLLIDFLDAGLMWLALTPWPPCPKCGGEAMRAKKQKDGVRRWHCRDCCHEWAASTPSEVEGNDERTS